MKILHIVPSYLPAYRYGGPILAVHALNKWLVRAGAEVTVFTTNADGKGSLKVPLGVPVDRDGVKVFYFPRSFPRRWFYSVAMHRALKARIHEFDLIHITSVFLAASTLGACAARRAKRPYIISPRGNLMKEPLAMKSALLKKYYLAFVEKKNLAHAAAIHFTDEAEREEYANAKFPLKQALVVPNGLDPETWPPLVPGELRTRLGVDPARRIVLAMGRIGWKKGFDTLIPAFARVAKKEPKALLVVSGADDEGYRARVQAMVQEHRLEEQVRFTGPFQGVDAVALADADVFALPSYSENFGMAAMQAMYAGVPVVVTPGVALSREVARVGAGLVVAKNEEAVADAILKILEDPKAARKMGERGKAFVLGLLAPAIAERFKEEYAKLISRT